MKMNHIGIDIIEIKRVREAISRWGGRFLQRIFTESELSLYQDKIESLATRFAGKEAVIKALSRSGRVFTWREIEILAEADGKPVVRLHGQALTQARDLGLSGVEISLSHSRENAIALVIGIRED